MKTLITSGPNEHTSLCMLICGVERNIHGMDWDDCAIGSGGVDTVAIGERVYWVIKLMNGRSTRLITSGDDSALATRERRRLHLYGEIGSWSYNVVCGSRLWGRSTVSSSRGWCPLGKLIISRNATRLSCIIFCGLQLNSTMEGYRFSRGSRRYDPYASSNHIPGKYSLLSWMLTIENRCDNLRRITAFLIVYCSYFYK